jgi:pimeloyl-ACP methyl ester carboxylesterase
MSVTHRFLEANGIRLHIAEAGAGPLVVLCHGFPESWRSWRHQLKALSEAGYHVVAPDMRGYGQTDRPDAVDQYTLFHLVGDVVGLVRALGEKSAVVVGHDWGAPVAWHCALFRPDIFRAVAALSVPFRPRGSARPTTLMPRTANEIFYQLYFQDEGVAEAEFEQDVRRTVRLVFGGGFDERGARVNVAMTPRGGGFLKSAHPPAVLPSWLSEADIDFYAAEFERTGFRGALNWYRNIDRNWELLAPWAGAKVETPALYIAGEHDIVVKFPGAQQLIANLGQLAPKLQRKVMLPHCGHWTQQEKPDEVNAALIDFLENL